MVVLMVDYLGIDSVEYSVVLMDSSMVGLTVSEKAGKSVILMVDCLAELKVWL